MSDAPNSTGGAAVMAALDHLGRADAAAANARALLAAFRSVAKPALASAQSEAVEQATPWLVALALIDALTNHTQTVRDNITAAAVDAGRITK